MIFILFGRQIIVVYVAFLCDKNPLSGYKVSVFATTPVNISNLRGNIFWGGFRG